MRPKVLVVQHVSYETAGTIGDALAARGADVEPLRVFEGRPVPRSSAALDGLVVMGGPMGVGETDRYPWLRDEMALIRDAAERGKPVLGVCLGSQLVAAALGGEMSRARSKEIGWGAVRLSAAGAEDPLFRGVGDELVPFHWHGDAFSLPPGAVGLASSALTPNQAFRFGASVYAIQFHMEVTREILDGMTGDYPKELAEVGLTPSDVLAGADLHLDALRDVCDRVAGAWLSLLAPE